MRNLTITRIKGFVGSLGNMRVYLEDRAGSELVIRGVPCRKLGTLKNGEEKIFRISDQEAKVFVIADRLTKEFSGEYYQLPEGQEDVHLTGKNTFNPFAGNPFRFENNESEGIKGHRRKAIAIGLIPVVLLCVSVVALICAFCAPSDSPAGDPTEGPSNGPKTFEQEGMRITLTEQFHSVSVPKFTVGYESDEVVVLALREEFSDVPALKIYDLKQYAELVLMANSIYGSDPRETDGLTLFEYDYTDRKTMVRYHYVCFVFKTEDSFWTVQFVTEKDKEYDYKWKFFQWAKTVTFE